jgi:hypothetical protein
LLENVFGKFYVSKMFCLYAILFWYHNALRAMLLSIMPCEIILFLPRLFFHF